MESGCVPVSEVGSMGLELGCAIDVGFVSCPSPTLTLMSMNAIPAAAGLPSNARYISGEFVWYVVNVKIVQALYIFMSQQD